MYGKVRRRAEVFYRQHGLLKTAAVAAGIAGLAVFAVAGGLTVHQYRSVQRREMVRSLESFTDVATTMSPEQRPGLVFQDFETIQKYPIPGDNELDMELLVALQK